MIIPIELEPIADQIRQEVGNFGAEIIEVFLRRMSGRSIVTLIVDKEGGITLDECAKINYRLGLVFDEILARGDDWVSGSFLAGRYFLEVNSPGLDRPLKSETDFSRAVGQAIKLIWHPEPGQTAVTIGKLLEVKDGALEIEVPNDKRIVRVRMEDVVRGTREVRFK